MGSFGQGRNMKVKKREKIEIIITLGKKEAYWLKESCQKFISNFYNEQEGGVEYKYRKRLLDLLDREGV